jgi:hypothetical protein
MMTISYIRGVGADLGCAVGGRQIRLLYAVNSLETSPPSLHKGKEEKSLVYMGWFSDMPYSEEASIRSQVLTEYLDITKK